MKTIKMKNDSIIRTGEFLKKTKFKGKASRGAIKFMKRLEEKQNDFNEGLFVIRKDYFEVDVLGELLVKDDMYIFKKDITKEGKKEFSDRLLELNEEEFEISFSEHTSKFEAMFEALENSEAELCGEDALAYDELLDAYESSEEEAKTNKKIKKAKTKEEK